MSRFRFNPVGGHPSQPWFRIGEFDVTTTVFTVGISIISFFVYAIDKTQLRHLFLWTSRVREGQVWRVVTWPLVNEPTIWGVIGLYFLYIWGSRVEGDIGRKRMAWLLLWITVIPALVCVALNLQPALANGIFLVELAVFVVFAAEYPYIRFLFNIPAWAIAGIFVGIQVLQLLGDRLYDDLYMLFLILAVALFVMRQFGLGESVSFIPRINWPGMRRPGTTAANAGKPKRKKSKSQADLTVVPQWTQPRQQDVVHDREIDELLDKIAANGLESLTPEERRRLDQASKRLRDRRD